jgi:hypothetical protein
MELHSINREERLYVMPCGSGYSCYGFDVLDRKARAVADWCGSLPPLAPKGTPEHFKECSEIMVDGAAHAAKTGKQCEAELVPELIGLEGRRVELTEPHGYKRRFYVGRSTGWLPCHLEITTRRSMGGAPVSFPKGSTVRVVR